MGSATIELPSIKADIGSIEDRIGDIRENVASLTAKVDAHVHEDRASFTRLESTITESGRGLQRLMFAQMGLIGMAFAGLGGLIGWKLYLDAGAFKVGGEPGEDVVEVSP